MMDRKLAHFTSWVFLGFVLVLALLAVYGMIEGMREWEIRATADTLHALQTMQAAGTPVP